MAVFSSNSHFYSLIAQAMFADMLAAEDVDIPSKEDFLDADLNEDGTLMFGEWKMWVEGMDHDEDDGETEESSESGESG